VKKIMILLFIVGGLIMLRPVDTFMKNIVGDIMYRRNLNIGIVKVVNADKSFNVEIAESGKIHKNIFTLSPDPDLAVDDKVRILYNGGNIDDPILLAPTIIAPPEIVMFENQLVYVITSYTNIANPDHRWGMPILAISDHNVTQVHVFCKRYGNPGTVNVKIYNADANKKPTGAFLSSGSFDGNTLGETGEWKEIDVSLYAFSEGNWYVIVFDVPGASSWHYFRWYGTFANVYPNAVAVYSNNAGLTWSNSIIDYSFKIYGY